MVVVERKRLIRTVAGAVLAALVGLVLVFVLRSGENTVPEVVDRTVPQANPSVAPALSEANPGSAPPIRTNTAWTVLDPDSVVELPEYKEIVPGRALVRISESLASWEEGDKVALEIPQLGISFDGWVERMEVGPWGNRSYIGWLNEANGEDYRFTITVGPKNVFAYLGTSQGAYELVASNEMGWLMPTQYMDQHVDYSQPDYYIVEEQPLDGE